MDLGHNFVLADSRGNIQKHDLAAVSRHIAEEAAGLIEVEYEPVPCVLSAPDAMQEGAPLLHEDLKTRELGARPFNGRGGRRHCP